MSLNQEKYREFYSCEEAEAWAMEHYAKLMTLSPENQVYKTISYYTGSEYKILNELLRIMPPCGTLEFDKIDLREYQEECEEIHLIADTLNEFALPESIVTFRFTHIKDIRKLCGKAIPRRGMVFADKAFLSTTLLKEQLVDFGKQNRCNCILKLFLPKGLHGAYVSFKDERDCLNEQEFLLPPNIKFEIISIRWFTFPAVIECVAQNA